LIGSTENRNHNQNDICEVEFSYGSSRLAIKEQYFTYSAADLVSDIGGYLGLVLGHSFLSTFYHAHTQLTRLMKDF
jgi:hypothetical protein